jgi:N,N'-diacetylchitobiose transport system substrate-binding protein
MYLPGEDWQTNLQFVFDAGGTIATEKGGTWTAALSSPAAQKGLTQYKAFQNDYSTASSQSATAYTPDPNQIFGDGLAASMSQVNPIPATVEAKYPALKGEIGTFPWPSENTAGSTMPVFLGGSVVAIPSKSTNQTLALKYLKLITSDAVQKADIVGIDGWTPVSTQLLQQTVGTLTPLQQPYFTAAQKSEPTPAAPGWATVESDLYMENLFGAISTGNKSVPDATKSSDALITAALNAK